MKISDYLELINKIGFEQILKLDFKGHENRCEALYIFWDTKHGILLCFDTYAGDVNSGNLYYNWIPKDMQAAHKYTSSGNFEKYDDEIVWIGDHDCRSNIDTNIRDLKKNGKFIVPWVRRPFLWLLHYMDKYKQNNVDNKKWKLINEQRILQLPKDVQIAIKGKNDKV